MIVVGTLLAWWGLAAFAVCEPAAPTTSALFWALVGASLTLLIWPQIDWAFGVVARALASIEINGPSVPLWNPDGPPYRQKRSFF